MKTTLILALVAISGAALAQTAPACCAKKAKDPVAEKEAAFLTQAAAMTLAAEGKKACCKSTAAKPIAKGAEGCCNAANAPKTFKVFVAGEGYAFFGCKDSAAEGRQALAAKGRKVGPVQKISK